MNILITLLVIVLVAYGMLKQYNPQAVLITAGIVFFTTSYYYLGLPPIPVEKSNGFLIFDIWLEVVLPTSKNYTIYKEKKDSDNNDPLD